MKFQWLSPPHVQAQAVLENIVRVFDSDAKAAETVLPYLRPKKPISLRTIEWFVTNYSKLHAPAVHDKYLAYTDVWTRPLFDCFARKGPRSTLLEVHLPDEGTYTTTIAQLHYLVWAHKEKIFDLVATNLEKIEAHMEETMRRNQEAKKVAQFIGVPKKRSTLTRVEVKTPFTVYTIETSVPLSVDYSLERKI